MDLFNALLDHLTLLTCVNPLIGACLVLIARRGGTDAARRIALVNCTATCLLAALMIVNYNPHATGASGAPGPLQMVSRFGWLNGAAGPQVEFAVGVDGVSVWFVALAAVLLLPALLCNEESGDCRPAAYYALLLCAQALAITLFASLDAVLFLACLESVLIPLFFLTGRYGGYGRRSASRKLLLFHFSGSLLVCAAILGCVAAQQQMHSLAKGAPQPAVFSIEALTVGAGNVLSIHQLAHLNESTHAYWDHARSWLFWALLCGLALKSALVPLHSWLAGSALETTPGVRILLVGVMIKAGLYGCIRFLIPCFPDACLEHAALLSSLAAWGVVYAALWTFAQNDSRKVIAGWSIASAGLSALGLFSLNAMGAAGAMLIMLHHGLATGCLVWLADRTPILQPVAAAADADGSHERSRNTALLAAVLAAVAAPGTAGFAGSTLAIVGVFSGNVSVRGNLTAVFWMLAGMVILAAALVQTNWPEVTGREPRIAEPAVGLDGRISPRAAFLVPGILFALIVAIGVSPRFLVDRLESSLRPILAAYTQAGAKTADRDRFSPRQSAERATTSR